MVTKIDNQVDYSVAMLDKIDTVLRSMVERKMQLTRDIEHIERLGWVDAKPYYREGKYLYLNSPHEGRGTNAGIYRR